MTFPRARIGRDDQVAGILPVRLENGTRAAYLRNGGGIDALIVLDRAMDVPWCSVNGVSLVWHGPGGILPAHPGTLNDDEFGRRFFGGLVTTCGLEAFGPSGSDEDGSWGIHGHVNHTAAEDVSLRTVAHDLHPYVEARGTIRQARMFGESLRLDRTWRAEIGARSLHLRDRVTNEGGKRVPHMLLYHCNAGYPLLDEHADAFVSHKNVAPRDARAREGIDVWYQGGPPDASFTEQVFIHEPVALEDGWAVAGVRNASLAGGIGFCVRFRPEQLPSCFSWRMLGERTYVMAVEPANCPTIEGRLAARKAGTLPFLEPGETREYDLRFDFLTAADLARYAGERARRPERAEND